MGHSTKQSREQDGDLHGPRLRECSSRRDCLGRGQRVCPHSSLASTPLSSGKAVFSGECFRYFTVGCTNVSLVLAKSTIHQGGLGLFTAEKIPTHTVLGCYPGRAYTMHGYLQMTRTLGLTQDDPQMVARNRYAVEYPYQDTTLVVDPLLPEEQAAYQLVAGSDTLLCSMRDRQQRYALCYINENSLGPANCQFLAVGHLLLVVTSGAIEAGHELFLHYGDRYERNGYHQPFPAPLQEVDGALPALYFSYGKQPARDPVYGDLGIVYTRGQGSLRPLAKCMCFLYREGASCMCGCS